MKALITLLGLSFLLVACGPSKEEILRQQMLIQQKADAERIEAQNRAKRAQDRLQAAIMHQRDSANDNLTISEANAIVSQLQINKSYYFNVDLQTDKYNYDQEIQSFSVIGMRVIHKDRNTIENIGILFDQMRINSALDIILAKETTENNLHQIIETDRGQRITAVLPNFKNAQTLQAKKDKWQLNESFFNDFDWVTTPEEAWKLTSVTGLKAQMELRFCDYAPCKTQYEYQNHPTTSYQAKVLSLIVYRADTKQIVAGFVSDEL